MYISIRTCIRIQRYEDEYTYIYIYVYVCVCMAIVWVGIDGQTYTYIYIDVDIDTDMNVDIDIDVDVCAQDICTPWPHSSVGSQNEHAAYDREGRRPENKTFLAGHLQNLVTQASSQQA